MDVMATPYRLVFFPEYADLRKQFDAYWRLNSASIMAHFKVKARKSADAQKMVEGHVGHAHLANLYSDVLSRIFAEKLSEKSPGREILFVEGMQLFDFDPKKRPQAVAVAYLVPELEMKPGGEINYEVRRPVVPEEEIEWERRVKEVQNQYRMVKDDPDPQVKINSNVQVDIHAKMMVSKAEDLLTEDDENWVVFEGGCLDEAWLEVKMVHIPELQKALLEHKLGDEFEVEFPGGRGPAKGKRVRSRVTIKGLQVIEYPEVNDDFAKDAGYTDMEDFRKRFHEDYEKYKTSAIQMAASDHFIRQIMMLSRVPPLPDNWVSLNVAKMVDDHVKQFNGDRDRAMRAFGSRDDIDFQDRFKGQLYRDFMQKLAIRKWCAIHGLDYKDQDAIVASMVEKAKWVDPPAPQEV